MQVVDPVQFWLKEAGLDVPLPALEILDRTVVQLRRQLAGSPVSQSLDLEVRHALSRAIRVQAEMRMLAQDFERIDGFAKELTVDHDGAGSVTVSVPPGWADRLDQMLRTRTCARCGVIVPGVPHGLEECDRELARDVMES